MHVWPKTTWRGAVPRKDGSCPYTCFRPKASVVGGLSVNLLTQLSVLYIFTTTGTCTVLEWCWILSEHSAGLSILHCWLCFTWMYGCQSMWAAGCCASRLQVAGRVDKILTHCAIGLLFTKDSQSGRQNNVFTCAKTFCNSGTYRNCFSKSLPKTKPNFCFPTLSTGALSWPLLCDSWHTIVWWFVHGMMCVFLT